METQFIMLHGGYVNVSCVNKLLQLGTWCTAIEAHALPTELRRLVTIFKLLRMNNYLPML
jgi:hypothetical protein